MKTCTITDPLIRYASPSTVYSYEGTAFFGSWMEHQGFRTTTVQTQKGGGNISTSTTETMVLRSIYNQTCGAILNGGFSSGFAYVWECEAAGVYPPEIRLGG